MFAIKGQPPGKVQRILTRYQRIGRSVDPVSSARGYEPHGRAPRQDWQCHCLVAGQWANRLISLQKAGRNLGAEAAPAIGKAPCRMGHRQIIGEGVHSGEIEVDQPGHTRRPASAHCQETDRRASRLGAALRATRRPENQARQTLPAPIPGKCLPSLPSRSHRPTCAMLANPMFVRVGRQNPARHDECQPALRPPRVPVRARAGQSKHRAGTQSAPPLCCPASGTPPRWHRGWCAGRGSPCPTR